MRHPRKRDGLKRPLHRGAGVSEGGVPVAEGIELAWREEQGGRGNDEVFEEALRESGIRKLLVEGVHFHAEGFEAAATAMMEAGTAGIDAGCAEKARYRFLGHAAGKKMAISAAVSDFGHLDSTAGTFGVFGIDGVAILPVATVVKERLG